MGILKTHDYLDSLCGVAGQDIVRAYNKRFNQTLAPKFVAGCRS
ncbi:hypothetical protein [Desulforapulum autotrophicum]|nr:hypothetical protein [Desulforapulum autotrophicum]